jgi:aryl-alcohol dehydrogenase-like predicted oxidoreductase
MCSIPHQDAQLGSHQKAKTMRALDDLVRAGKLLYVGISDAPAWVVSQANTLADWHGWTPFIGLQVRYSLTEREIERELMPMADALGLSVAAWSPLAGGVLSGKFTRSSVSEPTRVGAADISEHDLQIAREVDAVAEELGVTSSQVAIAWTMAHHPSMHPLLGAKRLDQLLDNLAAVDIVLPEQALIRLDEVSAITRGFPADFIESSRDFVYGPVVERLARNT